MLGAERGVWTGQPGAPWTPLCRVTSVASVQGGVCGLACPVLKIFFQGLPGKPAQLPFLLSSFFLSFFFNLN